MWERIERLIAKPWAPAWLGLGALLLCLPALQNGLQADDHIFAWKVEQGAPSWSLLELEERLVPWGRARGDFVWWSSPHLQARFFRPLAYLSHALEFRLWPHAAWLMHLINALIYGGAVALAAMLYRRLAPSHASAALAALLFAVDDGHAFSAGWISGRNTLLAVFFASWRPADGQALNRAGPGSVIGRFVLVDLESAMSWACIMRSLARL